MTDQDPAGELEQLDEQIRRVRELLAEYEAEKPDRAPARLLLLLGQLLCGRAELMVTAAASPAEGRPAEVLAVADLSHARSLLRRAADAVPITTVIDDEHPGLQARFVLGECCAGLYQLSGAAADAEEAVACFREVVHYAAPVDPLAATEVALRLADLLSDRARAEPDLAARLLRLYESRELLELAVKFGQDDAELYADALVLRALVAKHLLACERATGVDDPAAQAEFCSLLASTIREVPAEYPERWRVDWMFAEQCHLNYLNDDDPVVLEQALQHWELALAGARRDGEPPAELLGEFASTLASQWHRSDSQHDRNRAIALYEEATARGAEPGPMSMLECSVLLVDRCSSRNPDPDDPDPVALADLDSAIRLSTAAATAAQPDPELVQEAGLQLVCVLTEKIRHLNDDPGLVQHIDHAIRVTEPVLDNWTGDQQNRVQLVRALGFQRLRRFYQALDEHDLRTAIELLTTVYRETPPGDPDKTSDGALLALALDAGYQCGLLGEDHFNEQNQVHRGSRGGDAPGLEAGSPPFWGMSANPCSGVVPWSTSPPP